jgi:hypothetical protein
MCIWLSFIHCTSFSQLFNPSYLSYKLPFLSIRPTLTQNHATYMSSTSRHIQLSQPTRTKMLSKYNIIYKTEGGLDLFVIDDMRSYTKRHPELRTHPFPQRLVTRLLQLSPTVGIFASIRRRAAVLVGFLSGDTATLFRSR